MSSGPSNNPSPSKSQELSPGRTTSASLEASIQQATSVGSDYSAETPQPTAGLRSLSTPPDLLSTRRSVTSHPRPTAPLIFINESPAPQSSTEAERSLRQGRPLVARHALRNSSSQSPRRSRTPYGRPASVIRAQSQPRTTPTTTSTTMSSSGSSPGNTSTAGSGSGSSNPSYQLPYAPFPYPMPKPQGGNGGK
jgi:hypothetical protein